MPAELTKIRPAINSTPEMILGMLVGHRARIRHIAAVIIWDDDSTQLVNDAMTTRDLSWSLAAFQSVLLDHINREAQGD